MLKFQEDSAPPKIVLSIPFFSRLQPLMHEMHTSGENCDASEILKTFIKNEAEGNAPEKQKEGLRLYLRAIYHQSKLKA